MRISTPMLRRLCYTACAAEVAADLCAVGGWAHLWTFTHTWQFHTAWWTAIAVGLFSALALLGRVRRARQRREEWLASA